MMNYLENTRFVIPAKLVPYPIRERESSLPETDAGLLTLDSGSGAGMTFSYFVVLAASQNGKLP